MNESKIQKPTTKAQYWGIIVVIATLMLVAGTFVDQLNNQSFLAKEKHHTEYA